MENTPFKSMVFICLLFEIVDYHVNPKFAQEFDRQCLKREERSPNLLKT